MKGSIVFFICIVFHLQLCSQEKIQVNGKFVDVNNAKIYYQESGSGDPLILLHGFGKTASDWDPFIDSLSRHYKVIAWDMRGHGRSSSIDTSNIFLHKTAAMDLVEMIKVLRLENVKLVGHSSGGIVSLYAAVMEPALIDAIVPISAQLYFGDSVRAFIRENAKPEMYYEFMELEKLHGPVKGRLLARQFFHFNELRGDPMITTEQLTSITARALIVHGDNDFVPLDQAWEMYKKIQGASLYVIPKGWHEPHLLIENRTEFVRHLKAFLK
jgi:pimeloyl-ACP methyl ester carboxylesterase